MADGPDRSASPKLCSCTRKIHKTLGQKIFASSLFCRLSIDVGPHSDSGIYALGSPYGTSKRFSQGFQAKVLKTRGIPPRYTLSSSELLAPSTQAAPPISGSASTSCTVPSFTTYFAELDSLSKFSYLTCNASKTSPFTIPCLGTSVSPTNTPQVSHKAVPSA